MLEEKKKTRRALIDAITAPDRVSTEFLHVDCSAKMSLRIRYSRHAEPVQVTVKTDKPLADCVSDIKSTLSLAPSVSLKLIFDGSLLVLSRTPGELELEDEDLLEVMIDEKPK